MEDREIKEKDIKCSFCQDNFAARQISIYLFCSKCLEVYNYVNNKDCYVVDKIVNASINIKQHRVFAAEMNLKT